MVWLNSHLLCPILSTFSQPWWKNAMRSRKDVKQNPKRNQENTAALLRESHCNRPWICDKGLRWPKSVDWVLWRLHSQNHQLIVKSLMPTCSGERDRCRWARDRDRESVNGQRRHDKKKHHLTHLTLAKKQVLVAPSLRLIICETEKGEFWSLSPLTV